MKTFTASVGIILISIFVISPIAASGPNPSIKSIAVQDFEAPQENLVKELSSDKFYVNVIKATRQARRSGKITVAQAIRIRTAMLSPAFRKQAKELAIIQLAASDNADKIPMMDEKNIDWDALLAFIEKLIPIILQLIEAITGGLAMVDMPQPKAMVVPVRGPPISVSFHAVA